MKPAPLIGAVLLAAFLVLRRRKLEPTLLIGGAIAVVGLLVYGSGLVELPNFKKIVEDAGNTLGQWTYLVVGVMAFFETGAFVGLIAPGETFLIFGGVVAGQGTISLVTLIAIVWTCAVLGDLASFYAGRRLGRAFLIKHGSKVQITEERVHQVEGFFDRHGGKAIFLGRFVGLVRAVNPFLAGSSGMPLRRFLPYDIIGAGAWATMLLVLGYVFWQSFDRVLHYAEQGTLALGATIVVIAGGVWLYRHFRHEEHRDAAVAWLDKQLDRPALRPLAARPASDRALGPGPAEVLLEPDHARRARPGADDAAGDRRRRLVRVRRQRDHAAATRRSSPATAPRSPGPTRSGPARSTTSRAPSRTSAASRSSPRPPRWPSSSC